jgi:hypothetical protein
MTKLRFAGRKKELREFLDFLTLMWGSNRRVFNLPVVVCGDDGQSTHTPVQKRDAACAHPSS